MSLWDKLTGKRNALTEAELASRADGFLREVEHAVQTNPKSAMKAIFKRPTDIEPAIDFGTPFHERFTNLALKAAFLSRRPSSASAIERTCSDLLSVILISDSEVDTLGQLIDAIMKSDAEVVFMR